MTDDSNDAKKASDSPEPVKSTRRQMLLKLGLAAGALYTAPALMNLSQANASSLTSRGRRRKRPRRKIGTSITRPSRPRRRVPPRTI